MKANSLKQCHSRVLCGPEVHNARRHPYKSTAIIRQCQSFSMRALRLTYSLNGGDSVSVSIKHLLSTNYSGQGSSEEGRH